MAQNYCFYLTIFRPSNSFYAIVFIGYDGTPESAADIVAALQAASTGSNLEGGTTVYTVDIPETCKKQKMIW